MALSGLVAALAAQITAELDGAPVVDTAAVTALADVPRVTLSVDSATPAMRSVGQVPGPINSGALRIGVEIDLTDPVLHLADEDVALLSPNRRVFQLPHGSVVRASGDDLAPFSAADLTVRVGTTSFAPVHGTPAAGQVSLDVASGALTFPNPLPASGTVELGYFVGTWEVRVERFAANVHLDAYAASQAALDDLVPRLEQALSPPRITPDRGIRRIEPVALSGASTVAGLPPAARRQRLTYQVDFELIEPVIPTSGGPIRRIDVTVRSRPDTNQPAQTLPGENFTITEASEP